MELRFCSVAQKSRESLICNTEFIFAPSVGKLIETKIKEIWEICLDKKKIKNSFKKITSSRLYKNETKMVIGAKE